MHLSLNGISKRFPGVTALDAVDFEVHPGEVVGLVGENGAGKSTLMKILAGIHAPDEGTIRIDGRITSVKSPRDAARQGIAIIHQELATLDNLDIAGNVYLGREPTWCGPLRLIDRARIEADTAVALARVGLDLPPGTRLAGLSTAQQQLVEIARALSLNARLLIMDEPTSSLTLSETERLFGVVNALRGEGVSVAYISHRLSEIARLADRVVALRDGRNAGVLARHEISHDRMVSLMVGREVRGTAKAATSAGSAGALRLQLRGMRTARYPVAEVSIGIRSGEILGLAGLVGAGRSELARAVFGVDRALEGEVDIDGRSVVIRSPADAIAEGIYLVPEDRRQTGLITAMTIRENITLPSLDRYASAGWIRRSAETAAALRGCTDLNVKAPSVEMTVANLSGGNQQKVALARWMGLDPKVMLFDEPTRGIDVGAKAEIYRLMRDLVVRGVAILMISSDMEEILAESDRVAVMHDGRITGTLERFEFSEEAIMRLAVA